MNLSVVRRHPASLGLHHRQTTDVFITWRVSPLVLADGRWKTIHTQPDGMSAKISPVLHVNLENLNLVQGVHCKQRALQAAFFTHQLINARSTKIPPHPMADDLKMTTKKCYPTANQHEWKPMVFPGQHQHMCHVH